VNIMATLIHVPVALIMKVDPPYIGVFCSSESTGNPYKAGDREHLAGLYCEHVIKTRNKLLIPNSLKDKQWDKNPDIKLGMISYLGFPLLWPDGSVFGTICVLDLKENHYGKAYEELTSQFKTLVEAHLGLLYNYEQLEELVDERTVKLKDENLKLQQEIKKRKLAEEKLIVSLREKKVLLREIHDRVKNNMQIILSLLRLQSKSTQDERMQEKFRVAQNRIKSMALIHEKLYQSEDLARIDFSDYIGSLATHLFSKYGAEEETVRFNIEVMDVYLDINKAIPSGLIISELISNSLKHAFPEGRKGEITVRMQGDNKGKYKLIVSDTGVGFPEVLNFKETETLGMQLVNDLVKQINGTIKLERDGGTKFEITF